MSKQQPEELVCPACGEGLRDYAKALVVGVLVHADQRTSEGREYTCATDYMREQAKKAKQRRLREKRPKVAKQTVMDGDGHGGIIRAWAWVCCVCGEKEVASVGSAPWGWEVADENDLEYSDALCAECSEDESLVDELS